MSVYNRACKAEGLDHHCGEYSAEGPVAVTKVTFKWVLIHCCDALVPHVLSFSPLYPCLPVSQFD